MNAKPMWQSKTMWGGVLQLFTLILAQQGIEVTGDEQALVLDSGIAISAALTGLIGVIMTVWGRFTAKRPVTVTGANRAPKLKPPEVGLALVLAVSMTGCVTNDPEINYHNTQEAFIATVRVLNDAKALGKISDADWIDTVLPLINRGDALLDEMKGLAQSGNLPAFEMIMARLRDVLRELVIERAKLEERTSVYGPTNTRLAFVDDAGGRRPVGPQLQRTHREALPRLYRQTRRVA